MGEDQTTPKEFSRRSFIKTSAGVATGAAVVVAPAAVIAQMQGGSGPRPVPTEPTTPAPREPVMAYVHDAKRGEVTVLSGTDEITYKDPALVQRLLSAAPQSSPAIGGGADVLAP
jgi:hypothetical protein